MEIRNKNCGNCTQYRRCTKTKRKVKLDTLACDKHDFISEEKELDRIKRSNITRSYQENRTLEQKALAGKNISLGMKKMSPEKKSAMCKNQSISAVAKFDSMTLEEKEKFSKKMSEVVTLVHKNRTVEDELAIGKKIKETRSCMSIDKRHSMLEKQRQHALEREARKTVEEKLIINKKISDTSKRNYNDKTQEEKDAWTEHCTEIAINYHTNKTHNDELHRAAKISKAHSTPEAKRRNSEKATRQLKDPNNTFGNYPVRRQYKDTNIIMKSGWEINFASKLDEYNIFWLYEPKSFWLNTIKTHYTPDFFLPELDCYIEVKSLYYLDNLVYDKINAMYKEYMVYVFLMYDKNWNDILNILSIDYTSQIKFSKIEKLSRTIGLY